ncbi:MULTISPECIES: hypothetical protein [unclassified Mesorhizobium]|uniref:hypothetical protein n=1 Tax=unclassified Mesorhizobium TaxID=325217 RepID=UPI000FD9CA78|nr:MULTISPECIES: hypothetical protein [unclassified Mesorhizobium]TGT76695.1 hypothetical protein EN809_003565 [Mesorhizobium sp. M2E.F.Ca.ET.166.01.1.1]TGW02807.1 hypothetical protein EN797_003565 [Mesorhizobium sp. M2E.F.Ca.ET.154.01.1.1]
MTIAACFRHSPMHQFGKGYVCAMCGMPMSPPFRFDATEVLGKISEETKAALDDIDANIRYATMKAKDTFLD